jgi:hypothetical protein
VLSHVQLTSGVTLAWAASRILGTASAGNATTLVIYGPAGGSAELDFATTHPSHPLGDATPFHLTSQGLQLVASFRDGDPMEYSFTSGEKRIRILAVSEKRAAATWFVETEGSTYVVSGPSYVGEARVEAGHLQFTGERPWLALKPEPEVIAYGAGTTPISFSTRCSRL